LANALFFSEDLIVQILVLFIPGGLLFGFHVSVSCMVCRDKDKQYQGSVLDDNDIEE